MDAVKALLANGANVNDTTDTDGTTALLEATINGQFDVALLLIDKGADVNKVAKTGFTPLYATINTQWAPKSRYPQPQALQNQKASYLDVMEALLERARIRTSASRRSRSTSLTTTAATRTVVSSRSKARRRSGAPPTRST